MAEFVRVAAVSDIPNGEGRPFEIGDTEVAIFNVDGTFFAINNLCKHQGGPLGEGELDGKVVTCPWHDWTYDVTSGASPEDPDCSVDKYEVKVEGEDILVAVS